MSCYFSQRSLFGILCILLAISCMSNGCFEEERTALLDICSSLLGTTVGMPPSWLESDNCCSWERVICNNSTKRISHLYLSRLSFLSDEFSPKSGCRMNLNSTAFSVFPELQFLDFSMNDGTFQSWEGLVGLTKLRHLNLSNNCLNGTTIPSSLGKLGSLEVLHLEFNGMVGTLPTLAFENLRNLRELYLSSNQFNGSLPASLFTLPHIEHLDLSQNLIEGSIPMTSSSNPSSSLKALNFSINSLGGYFSFFSLRNLTNLEMVDLSRNANLFVGVNFPGWTPSFQLKQLLLSGCELDKSIIAKPHFLRTQHQLEVLDLSNNNLPGSMPNWLFTKKAKLLYLNLGNNSLTGSLDSVRYPQTNVLVISLSMNRVSGYLPANISSMFPNLTFLDFSFNMIAGDIPSSLCNISSMEILNLSNNNFSGQMPTCLLTNYTNLQYLKVSKNKLGGPILGGTSHLSIKLGLYMDGNKFEGPLPQNLTADFEDGTLDFHDNKLSGKLDFSLWNLPGLLTLILAGNSFTGEIHPSICSLTSLMLLDISNNNLSGAIPNCSTAIVREFLNVSGNSLSGDILPYFFFDSSVVSALDLSHNQFSGNLEWIRYLVRIRYLSLGSNKFEGQISPNLCQLQSLRIIDLSDNSLSGSLPSCIGNLSFEENSYYVPYWTLICGTGFQYLSFKYSTCYEQRGFRFATKWNLYTYKRNFINWFSGIDLSTNKLSGEIPWELGNMNDIKALNLSYNLFSGPIPPTLANMSEIESLDLSRNKLSGPIPWQLTHLSSLEVFSVAYNNLSGCIPNSGQFGSFDIDSYKGNNNLYKASQGSGCNSIPGPGPSPLQDSDKKAGDPVLYAVGAVSFVSTFWATVAFIFCHSFGRRVILKLQPVKLTSSCVAGM